MRIYVYPGSFDPVTNGHLDVISRASVLCDKLIVAVLVNNSKNPSFSLEERVEMLRESIKGINNVEIESFTGLLIDFMAKKNASVIIKGLRVVSDFEYELPDGTSEQKPKPEDRDIVYDVKHKLFFLSSSSVKELARHNGNIDGLVPDSIKDKVMSKFRK